MAKNNREGNMGQKKRHQKSGDGRRKWKDRGNHGSAKRSATRQQGNLQQRQP